MHADLAKGRPQAVKASQLWLSCARKCAGWMMSAQVWPACEPVHSEVCNGIYRSHLGVLTQGPQ